MAENILLGFPNRIDSATLSGGSWVPTLPLANLQDRQFARVARSTGLEPEETTFTLDLTEPRRIRMLAFVNHNLSLTARVKVEASSTPDFAAGTILHSATFDAWGSLVNADWNPDDLDWEGDNYWTGTYSREDLAGMTPISSHILPDDVFARYWRMSIADESNPDGFVEIGRLFISGAIQPRINYSWGAGLGYEVGTGVETALGGAEFFDVREPVRVFRFTLEWMRDDEAFGRFLELVRRAGIHGEIFVVPDPDDFGNGQRRNFMGRIRQPSPLEQVTWANGGSAHSMAFEIKELR